MAIDNPKSLIRVFESSNQKLLQFGALLVSDDTPIGGMVLGFGGSFIADAPEEIRSQAKTLLNLIDQLTGTRRSSSGISQDWLNAIQVEPTRELVHQELVRDAYQFMKNQTLSSRLFVTETLLPIGPHVYQLELINWDNPRSTNRQLAQVAKEKVKDLPCQQGQARAIGFVQNIADQPTLKLVTLRKNGKWVIRDRSIQFPSPIEFRISRFAEQPKIADQSKNDPSSVSDFSNFDSPSSNQVYMTD
jgi:hypothetical protein